MTVNEAYKVLEKLRKMGLGNLELIATDGRSGVSSNIDIYATMSEKTKSDQAGTLCDWEDGDNYVAVYLDH